MSPKTKEQNEHIKDERREELLMAALKVFVQKGLTASKIGDIAAEACMSHGLVYHYFPSKDDIYIELVRRAVGGASESLLRLEELPLEPLEKIREIARATLEGIDRSQESAYYFYLMIQAFVTNSGPDEARGIAQGASVPVEVLTRVVTEGLTKGQLRDGDSAEYVLMFWAAVQGLAMNKIARCGSMRMPDAELLVRMFEK